MLVLRIVGVLAVIAIGASVLAFVFTGDRRHLAFAWRVAKYAIVVALITLSLFFLERIIAPLV